MSKVKNTRFYNIALAVGGSHYPEVNGELLEKFGEAIVKECALVAGLMEHEGKKNIGSQILDRFNIGLTNADCGVHH